MLTLLLALACAKTTAPADPTDAPPEPSLPAGVSQTPATTPVPPGAVPPADGPPTPPLAGTTEAMVIEGLTRSQLIFTVGADLSPLALIDQSEADVLAAHLAAHPLWRLTRWEGATMAMMRVDDQKLGRTVPWAGYHDGDAGQWRAALRLRPRQPGAEWTESPLVDRFEPDDSELMVRGWQPAGEGWYAWRASAIEVDGKVASMELHELSQQLELTATSEAIKWITTDLLSLDKFKQDSTDDAPAWGWLPPGEPTQDAKGLYVSVTDDGVDIRGRLNPGEAGWTWARITDPQGRAWLEELTAAATLERMGWDADDSRSFWFQGRVPTDLSVPAGSAVEVWFLADGATKPVQIGRWATGS